MKDQYTHYPEQKNLSNDGSKFPEHKLVERSDKEEEMATEEHNEHKVVNTNDAMDEF